jgi:DNA excision repair protein ERCC-2
LVAIADFITLISTYHEGFAIIAEPSPEENRGAASRGSSSGPLLQLLCLDSKLAMQSIFANSHKVIFTSGTLSPLSSYSKLLLSDNLQEAALMTAIDVKLPRNIISPVVVTKGVDQLSMSSKFSERDNQGNIRNYGNLIVELSATVPDGMICYFTSYKYMEHMILQWNEMKILQKVLENKLMFVET